MEKQKKVERWSYPFKAKGTGNAPSSEVTDPQVYYSALAKAESGYYPIASNGLWHGGVHFDQNTAAFLDQSSVRCIADGVVVAYRIDETYKKLTYTGSGTPKEVTYSTGFVLVKHRLELPPAPVPVPPPAGETSPAATPPVEPDLTFFSLYMHLMDWQGYQDKPDLERPAFWAGDTRIVKQSAPDKLMGLRVRATANGAVLGVLPRGTLVEAGAPDPDANPNWLKFIRATPAVEGLAENTGFLHKGPDNGTILQALGEGRYIVNHKADDPITPVKKGANIRSGANSNSTILGLLPAGTQVRIAPTATAQSYHKLLAITGGSATPDVSAEQLATGGYVWAKDLEAIREPQARGSVFLVDPPVPIQAGALVGHLGKYQAASQSEAHDLLHLEVFSCDNVDSFITQSRARAEQLKPEQKTLLKIPAETKVITKDGATQANPPLISDPGQATAYDMIFPLAVLNALQAEKKITVTTTAGGTTTTEQWWKLDKLPGKDGNPFSGWVKEDELITPRLHPWAWEGFDFIKETSTPSEQYVCKLSADGVLDDGEKTNYKVQVNEGDGGPVKKRLYEIIDVDGDEKLTPNEIRDALAKPWHAQSISRLIAQYESEWYADEGLSKWEALNCYMTKEAEKDWTQEKERIKSLLWWSDLRGKLQLPAEINWHLHPISVISGFNVSSTELITLEMLKLANPSVSEEYYKTILPFLNKYAEKFKVNTKLRISHLLAQTGHESGFKVTQENLNYSARQMRKIFGCRKNQAGYNSTTDECIILPRLRPKLWDEESTYAHNPESLGNYVYANRNGNGNEASGDGYKYRGRGIIQLTGKSNYAGYTTIHNANNPGDPQDFTVNPDLIVQNIDYGIESAFAWWKMNNMNNFIDNSYNQHGEAEISDHVKEVSAKVNGGSIGLNERVQLFNKIRDLAK